MNTDWIDVNLDYLGDRLGPALRLATTTDFTPSPQLYDALFRASRFEFLIRQLCAHAGISIVPEVEVVGDSDVPLFDLQAGLRFSEKEIDAGGDYREVAPLSPKIRVGASHLRRPRSFCRICAHELAHHVLRSKLVRAPSEHEGEMLTDLAAVYVGFGKMVLNAAVDTGTASAKEPIHLSEKGVAYLGYPLLSYAYYVCQAKRGVGKRDMYSSLEGPCVRQVRAFTYHHGCERNWWTVVLELLGIAPALPQTDGIATYQGAWRLDENRYRVVACPRCGARARIPKSDKRLEVTCPKCRRVFLVEFRYKQQH